jgi:MFS family permease
VLRRKIHRPLLRTHPEHGPPAIHSRCTGRKPAAPLSPGTRRQLRGDPAILKAIAPVSALLLSICFLIAGNGLQGSLLPLRAALDQQSALEIGILGSSYFLGFGAGCFSAAQLIARVGHIRVFTAAVALASALALMHALVTLPAVWWVLRAMTGFSFAVLYIVIESWLADKSDETTRGTVFSVYTIVNLTVLTAGQAMLMLGDPQDFPLFLVASILVSLAAIPVAMSRSQAPDPPETFQLRLRHLISLSPAGMGGAFCVGLSNGTFWSLGPLFASETIASIAPTQAVALFMSAVVLGGAAGQWPLGSLSDHQDRRRIIALASLAAVLPGLVLFAAADTLDIWLVLIAAAFGFFAFPLYALSVAHTNDVIDRADFVEAASGLLLLYGAGAVMGPIFASALASFLGTPAIFIATAAIHAGLAVFILLRITQKRVAVEADQPSFAQSLISANTTSQIPPGAEQLEDATP